GAGNRIGTLDGAAADALFNSPSGLALGPDGTLYVADSGNNTVRAIFPAGVVTTVAGSPGMAGYSDGPAHLAFFHSPTGVAVDRHGNIYVADTLNQVIRKIAGGQVSTLAGTVGIKGSADGFGPAAQFNQPSGLALDANGNLYVADGENDTIRRITP